MANLGRKGDIYVTRFRYLGREYKKSLKTTSASDARAAMHGIEQVIHRLTIGLAQVPPGVDPGDFIQSGGTAKAPAAHRTEAIPVGALIKEFLDNQSHLSASYLATQAVHLRISPKV